MLHDHDNSKSTFQLSAFFFLFTEFTESIDANDTDRISKHILLLYVLHEVFYNKLNSTKLLPAPTHLI